MFGRHVYFPYSYEIVVSRDTLLQHPSTQRARYFSWCFYVVDIVCWVAELAI